MAPPSGIRHDLRLVYSEGMAWSVMVGLGETYFPAFALALGMGEVWAGLIATIPVLAGGLLQLVTPMGVSRLRSRRRWVVACAIIQAASFLPLIAGVAAGHLPGVVLFLVAGIYWGAGLAAGPAWNAWITQIVPRRVRAPFFSRRSQASQIGVFTGLLLGGFILQALTSPDKPLLGFGLIFLLAGISRLVSSRFLLRQRETHPPRRRERIVAGKKLWGKIRHGQEGRLLLYMVLMTATVSIASPFFTPFMLKSLGLSYLAYMSLIGASFAAKIVALSFLGRVVKRTGTLELLRFGGVGIVIIPVFWLLSGNYFFLLGLQVISGVLWASHELACMLIFLEAIREEERVSLLTTFNLATASVMVAGSLLGGALFGALGGDRLGYHAVFGLSAAARLGAVALLVGISMRVRPTMLPAFRIIAVRPSAGMIFRAIHSTLPRPSSPAKDITDPTK